MLEFVKDTIYEVAGTRNVTMSTDFVKDLALNSLDVMNVICAFEDHFGITIPTREAWNLRQVKDLIEYLAARNITEP